jgi:hypothetical protein
MEIGILLHQKLQAFRSDDKHRIGIILDGLPSSKGQRSWNRNQTSFNALYDNDGKARKPVESRDIIAGL